MNTQQLSMLAKVVIKEISVFLTKNESNQAIESIRVQMRFIIKHCDGGEDPRLCLKENTFSFGVIASRELTSPDEIKIKKAIDKVTEFFVRNPSRSE